MRNLLIIIVSCSFLSSCSSPNPKGNCPTELSEVFKLNDPYGSPGGHLYLNATYFDKKNKDCWKYLKHKADWYATGCKPPVTVHVFDNMPNFQAPSNGKLYGTEAIQKRVIYQYLILANRSVQEYPDPFGYGIYTIPK